MYNNWITNFVLFTKDMVGWLSSCWSVFPVKYFCECFYILLSGLILNYLCTSVDQNICVDCFAGQLLVSPTQIFLHLCWSEYLCWLFFASRCLLLKYSPAWRRVARGWPSWLYACPAHPIFMEISEYFPIDKEISKYSHRNMEMFSCLLSKVLRLLWLKHNPLLIFCLLGCIST